jgi:dCMP deaminase
MLGRKRPGDPKTLKEFIASEKKESQVRGSGQQLSLCARMAGRTIINAGAVKNVYKAIDVMTKELRKKMPPAYHRPNWDEYFMEICKVVGKRGTCDRGRAGAVIVKDKRIIATGYVGSPAGLAHCDEVGHLMHDVTNPDGKVSRHCIRTAHAEQNAIVQAALHGVSTNGATIYIKFEPCLVCTKMIINAGIRRVVAEKRYHAAALSRQFLQEAGVELDVLHDELEQYPDQHK